MMDAVSRRPEFSCPGRPGLQSPPGPVGRPGRMGTLGAGETMHGRHPFWRLPIVTLYILRATFRWTEGDDLYGVTASASITSFN